MADLNQLFKYWDNSDVSLITNWEGRASSPLDLQILDHIQMHTSLTNKDINFLVMADSPRRQQDVRNKIKKLLKEGKIHKIGWGEYKFGKAYSSDVTGDGPVSFPKEVLWNIIGYQVSMEVADRRKRLQLSYADIDLIDGLSDRCKYHYSRVTVDYSDKHKRRRMWNNLSNGSEVLHYVWDLPHGFLHPEDLPMKSSVAEWCDNICNYYEAWIAGTDMDDTLTAYRYAFTAGLRSTDRPKKRIKRNHSTAALAIAEERARLRLWGSAYRSDPTGDGPVMSAASEYFVAATTNRWTHNCSVPDGTQPSVKKVATSFSKGPKDFATWEEYIQALRDWQASDEYKNLKQLQEDEINDFNRPPERTTVESKVYPVAWDSRFNTTEEVNQSVTVEGILQNEEINAINANAIKACDEWQKKYDQQWGPYARCSGRKSGRPGHTTF